MDNQAIMPIGFPLQNWRRLLERPHTTWMKTMQQDLRSKKAIDVAQNRPL